MSFSFYFGLVDGISIGILIMRWFLLKKKESKQENLQSISEKHFDDGRVYKVAFIINDQLKMSKGKIMAQCAHAAVGIYESYFQIKKSDFEIWETQGKSIVIYKVESGSSLKLLNKAAIEQNMIAFLVRDAGRTQIPSGSITVLVIGPEEESALNCMTQHLTVIT